jgi:ribonuclease BN (tRNA processing enzyme)
VQAPVLALVPIEIGQVVAAGAALVEALPASHTVPAVGYAVTPASRPGRRRLGLHRRHRAEPGAVATGWPR